MSGRSERQIQADIMLALAEHGMTAWRNNVGTGWAGRAMRRADGSVLVRDARPLHAGLCNGSADLIGLRPVVVTPAMVGETIAQFVALEVKRPRQYPTADQRRFLAFIEEAGGLARVVRAVSDLPPRADVPGVGHGAGADE